MIQAGISAYALATTSHVLSLDALAQLRNVDPGKYLHGLGCVEMSIPAPNESATTLGVRAAREALEQWGGDPADIGLFVVGTETAADMSRPLSGFIAHELGLCGSFRSYEVKHACYGGTAAVRQATEWIASGAARGRAALVVATDIALYAPGDPGEPTQGAGAAAFVVDADARIAEIELDSYAYTMPVLDFWRPVGDAFPSVDGPLSLSAYKECARACFGAWADVEGASAIDQLRAVCFHVPFAKMVKKAWFDMAEAVGVPDAQSYYDNRVVPHMAWNARIGNAYTASAWFALGHALSQAPERSRIALFSYGSGAGAELMFVRVKRPLDGSWANRVERMLDEREPMSAEAYGTMRGSDIA